MIKEMINKAAQGRDLSREEARGVFDEIMSGGATDSQIAAFITALRIKGETVDEITGAARVMREKALKITPGPFPGKEPLVDTCGTGGSGQDTFNISTASAFVAAACGVRVAKHGNRSASSRCGSADVLERLGVGINISADRVKKCIEEIGIGFLFAPLYHSAMKYAIGPRKEIGIRTIFNVLGPLSNPAGAGRQVVGVYDARLVPIVARVLRNLGCERALVVHGMDPLDEISISSGTIVGELNKGRVRTRVLAPADFGFKKTSVRNISGGGPEENAGHILDVLNGKKGPRRDVVIMNAAAALVVSCKAGNLRSGVRIAAESIDTGKAKEKLDCLKQMTGGS
ncbi:MAG: anthranilate phosphoribosyltransferase [Candidatus Omnitrophota bacterium]